MHIHILGICGTFMGGVAKLAKQLGHEVTGCDENVYPPMSDVLRAAGIEVMAGYQPENMGVSIDLVIIGNAMSRGNPCVEHVLNKNIAYISGPQWIYENVLRHKHVLAVSGTHGKTTTSALLAWILETADLSPGFLIGGMPHNFDETTRLGTGEFFVIEADEYDTAFFDKRSKFLHYHPRTLIVNNLEYDHADIFSDIAAIKTQFQFLLRTVPSTGSVIYPQDDINVQDVLSRGCWSTKIAIGSELAWQAKNIANDGSCFELWYRDQKLATLSWSLIGMHNIKNALVAIAAAHEVGVSIAVIEKAISTFKSVKRRLEIRGRVNDITIYDDFAHHPTAIATTIAGLRAKVGDDRIIVIAQLGSNSWKMGIHKESICSAFKGADQVHVFNPPNEDWGLDNILKPLGTRAFTHKTVNDIIKAVSPALRPKDHVLVMSNKGFEGIHHRLLETLH